MCLEFGAEDPGMNLLPLGSSPCRIVDSVGDIADEQFLGKVTRIHPAEDILAHLAMQPGNSIDILGEAGCKETHAELLMLVGSVRFAQSHHGLPVDLESLGIVADVFPEQSFVEGVMAGGNGRVGSEQGRSLYHLDCFSEIKVVLLDQFPQPLETGKCSMSFVAMIDLRIYSEVPESPYSTYTQKEFLLQAILPVTTVKMVGYLAVFWNVGLIVGVKKVQVSTSHGNFPDPGCNVSSREGHAGSHPVA